MRRTFCRIATDVVLWVSLALLPGRAGAYEGIAVEADGSLVVTSFDSRSVYRIDPVTGAATVLSSETVGNGPALNQLRAIAVAGDGSLWVAQFTSILRMDAITGDRTLVSGMAKGSGPMLLGVQDIALGADGTVFVADRVAQAVLRVDPSTGDRVNVSPGSPIIGVNAVAVESTGALVVASDRTFIRLDPATGQRTTFSDRQNGSGPSLRSPVGIERAADGNLVVATAVSAIGVPISAAFVGFAREAAMGRVDATTGDRVLISGGGICLYVFVPGFEQCLTPFLGRVGRGPAFGSLREVAVEADGSLLGVTGNVSPGGVTRVAPENGQRTVLAPAVATSPTASQRLRAGATDGEGMVRQDLGLGPEAKASVRRVLREARVPLRGPALARHLAALTPPERNALGARLYAALWPLMHDDLGEGEPTAAPTP